MATEESNIVQNCRITGGKLGARLFRNSRGLFYTLDIVPKILAAAKQYGLKGVFDLLNSGRLRKSRAGLEVPGSSDLIGWHTVIVTPEMVGKPVAVFCAVEVKTEKGKISDDQHHFISKVVEGGGIAGVVRCPEDLEILIKNYPN